MEPGLSSAMQRLLGQLARIILILYICALKFGSLIKDIDSKIYREKIIELKKLPKLIEKSLLLDNEIQQKNKERSEQRKTQVGSGDRSERIRTYNFPQGRVSDHRINLTLYNLTEILEGNLDELINPLITNEETSKLAELDNE